MKKKENSDVKYVDIKVKLRDKIIQDYEQGKTDN